VKDFSIAPASRNDCGFSAITSVATVPTSFGDGLRRTPFVTSALISSAGCGSITTTRLPSNPCASQPDSKAPPIFPAPARTMVVLISCKALVVFEVIRNKYLRRPLRTQGPITPSVSIETRDRPQALYLNFGDTTYGSLRSQGRLSRHCQA
jgi:hypothetical protein